MLPLVEKLAVRVEDLDAIVLAIPDVDPSLCVDRNSVRQVELARAVAFLAPCGEEGTVFRELRDSGIAVTVGNVEVAVGREGDIGGTVERVVAFTALSPAAHDHQYTSPGTELEDNMEAAVGDPEIAFGINLQTVRGLEQTLTHRANEAALATDFDNRLCPAMEDVDLLPRTHRDAGRFEEVHAEWQLGPAGDEFIRQRRRRRLRRYQSERHNSQQDDLEKHDYLSSLDWSATAPGRPGVARGGNDPQSMIHAMTGPRASALWKLNPRATRVTCGWHANTRGCAGNI